MSRHWPRGVVVVRNIKCEIMFCSLDWTSHSVPHRSNIFHKYLLVSQDSCVENVLLVEQLVDQLVDQSISLNDGISSNYDPMKSQSLCFQIRLSSSETRFRSTPYFPSPLLAFSSKPNKHQVQVSYPRTNPLPEHRAGVRNVLGSAHGPQGPARELGDYYKHNFIKLIALQSHSPLTVII